MNAHAETPSRALTPTHIHKHAHTHTNTRAHTYTNTRARTLWVFIMYAKWDPRPDFMYRCEIIPGKESTSWVVRWEGYWNAYRKSLVLRDWSDHQIYRRWYNGGLLVWFPPWQHGWEHHLILAIIQVRSFHLKETLNLVDVQKRRSSFIDSS